MMNEVLSYDYARVSQSEHLRKFVLGDAWEVISEYDEVYFLFWSSGIVLTQLIHPNMRPSWNFVSAMLCT